MAQAAKAIVSPGERVRVGQRFPQQTAKFLRRGEGAAHLVGSGQEQLLAHRLKVYVQILIQESLLLSSILHYKFK